LVATDQDQVAGFGNKIQRQSTLDDVAFDFAGPGPIKVGHRLEALDSGQTQALFQTAARAFGIKCFKPMADFDWSWPSKIERDIIERALTLDFVTEARNLVLVGRNNPATLCYTSLISRKHR
jgi:hypothetical protein